MDASDFGTQLAQLVAAGYSQQQAQALLQQAYAKSQANIADVKGQYQNLATPGYKQITPTNLGPSELGNIQNDPQGRAAEQQAMAQLQDLQNRGGLNLSDQAALNNIQGNLNRNQMGRDAALRNEYAAKGQLGGGAQLAMELNQGQQANQSANQQGESAAAQAQQRAMQAIQQKATLGRTMSQDEYDKAAKAAQANDLIKQHNAANSMQAQQENNQWLNTGFGNNLSKVNGQAGLLNAQTGTNEKSGQAAANSAIGTGNLLQSGLSTAGKAAGSLAGSAGSSNGGGYDGNQDAGRGSASDLSGGQSLASLDDKDTTVNDYSNPWGGF